MAVKVRSTHISIFGHCFYLKFKTGAEKAFAFKFKKFKQFSSFWKPERWAIYVAISSVQFNIEHRWILLGPGEK